MARRATAKPVARWRRKRRHPFLSAVVVAVMCGIVVLAGKYHNFDEPEPVFGLSRSLAAVNVSSCKTTKSDQALCHCHVNSCKKHQCCGAELTPGASHSVCLNSFELNGGLALYIFLILYIFVALAIVCDDYFVASLEQISEGLGLSEDVAGATFMAAGSSAPELFVSLADNTISNPPKSLGVGTIVGSAIFNILIIIGLTALLAGQTLQLDWRPLARDCTWYSISIALLIFTVYDQEVQWYDAVVLLVGYTGYCVYMYFNARILAHFDNKAAAGAAGAGAGAGAEGLELGAIENGEGEAAEQQGEGKGQGEGEGEEVKGEEQKGEEVKGEEKAQAPLSNVERFNASAGVDNTAGSRSTMPARVNMTIDSTRPADLEEIRLEAEGVIAAPRRNSDSSHARETSERRRSSINPMYSADNRWRSLVRDKQGNVVRGGLRSVARALIDDAALRQRAVDTSGSAAAPTVMTGSEAGAAGDGGTVVSQLAVEGEELEEEELGPYWGVLMWPQANAEEEEGMAGTPCGDWGSLWGSRLWYLFTFPLNLSMRLTIPDCSYPRFQSPCGYTSTFFCSILWIGLLSHFLTYFVSKFGCIVGIPIPIMGLTILAAGTSVPDALSSVLVARSGQGDMAVANSIGSNVFDILMGLGLPYLLSTVFVYQRPVAVQTEALNISVAFLYGVLVCVLAILGCTKWRLHKPVGGALFALYFLYVLFALIVQPLLVRNSNA